MTGSPPPPETNIFIAVLGVTGAGKSSFIHTVTDDKKIKIGKGLQSCTKVIEVSYIQYRTKSNVAYNLFLLDTPGFDDDVVPDTDILKEIAAWLKMQYSAGMMLSGIIYLQRITDDRFGGQGVRNIEMLKSLCGTDSLKNVVLVTNRWEKLITPSDQEMATARLKDDLLDGYFKDLMDHKAQHMAYNGTKEKANEIIDAIIKNAPEPLHIQQELYSGIRLPETDAGKNAVTVVQREAQKYAADLDEIERQFEAIHRSMTENQRNELRRKRKKKELSEKSLQSYKSDVDPLEARITELKTMIAEDLLPASPTTREAPRNRLSWSRIWRKDSGHYHSRSCVIS